MTPWRRPPAAVEFAWRHADYRLVWWIDAEQEALVGDQLAALAPGLRLPVSGDAGGRRGPPCGRH